MEARLTRDNFWNTNLSDIESTFLLNNSKITEYPTYLNDVVPEQGSVLLNKVINTDKILKQPTFFQSIYLFFK